MVATQALRTLKPQLRAWLRNSSDFYGPIKTWPRFAREVRDQNRKLLATLPEFREPILVAGCQRSGTTAVSRLLSKTGQLGNFWTRDDEELDAALILSGEEPHNSDARLCFQTTYLNDSYVEYFEHIDAYKLIWIVRNPYSVVFSLLYNWESYAFKELYQSCGQAWWQTNRGDQHAVAPDLVSQACSSYNAKAQQLELLAAKLDAQLWPVDYDLLVAEKHKVLPAMFEFLGLDYQADYAQHLHASSLHKADRLSATERDTVKLLSEASYLTSKKYCRAP